MTPQLTATDMFIVCQLDPPLSTTNIIPLLREIAKESDPTVAIVD